jgi:hypothetical protein
MEILLLYSFRLKKQSSTQSQGQSQSRVRLAFYLGTFNLWIYLSRNSIDGLVRFPSTNMGTATFRGCHGAIHCDNLIQVRELLEFVNKAPSLYLQQSCPQNACLLQIVQSNLN